MSPRAVWRLGPVVYSQWLSCTQAQLLRSVRDQLAYVVSFRYDGPTLLNQGWLLALVTNVHASLVCGVKHMVHAHPPCS